MDLGLSEEQEMLRTSARDFLQKECPKQLVKQLDESDEGYSPELWRKMAELGWMGLVLPEEYGGSGGSFLDLVVLLEEMGYNILPGPFFSTVVLGGLSILAAGNEERTGVGLGGHGEPRRDLLVLDDAEFEVCPAEVNSNELLRHG